MKDIFNLIEKLHIVVLGDIIADQYIIGKATRISPEAPIPIVLQESIELRAGGAANVMANLQALKVSCNLIGIVGEDTPGKDILQLFQNEQIIKDTKRKTTLKTRVLVQNHQIVRIDNEETNPISEETTNLILEKISKIHQEKKIDCIIFQDYEKGLFHSENIHLFINHCKLLKIKIAVDPKDKNFGYYKNVDLLKPNLNEFKKYLGLTMVLSEGQLKIEAQKLRENLNCINLILTLSEKGVYIQNDHNSYFLLPKNRNIIDVCGAGDAVIAAVSATFCITQDVHILSLIANICGGIVCEQIGVANILLQKLKIEYEDADYLK